jgi:integrase
VSYPVEIDGITRRKRRMFSTEQKANDFATDHEKDVVDFGVRFGAITAEARRAFDFYRDARAELRGDEIEVPTFEALVMDAVSRLRHEHADRQRARMTVAEAVEAFLDYKKPRVGTGFAKILGGQLRRFAGAYGTEPLDKVTAADIEAWLGSLRSPRGARSLLNPTTRNKVRKSLKSLFAYGLAPARAWCHRNPLADIDPEKVKTSEPRAYTPEDAAKIMQTALAMNSPLLPSLALGMFAGLRPSETESIDLAVINLESDGFRTPAHHRNGQPTKTGARIAPLTPACKAWFATQTRRKGFAWQGDSDAYYLEMRAILSAAKVKGIFDGFRHSFITYRTAETRDVARVADECGNSPNIIKKHYRELVTADAAKKFFAIRPEGKSGRKSKITNIQDGRAIA